MGDGASPSRLPPHRIIPAPASLRLTPEDSFVIDASTTVVIAGEGTTEVEQVARALAETIGTPPAPDSREGRVIGTGRGGTITLALDPARDTLGPEGYDLAVAPDRVTLTARQPAGLFYGVQTLRQLLPAAVEHHAALSRSLTMPVGRIVDTPRFAWRGAMLDVARHFLPVPDVKRFIDLLALYKLNRLHLHLTDDQGWRIEITARPNLARHGGSTQVGGGAGGYYTQAEFADLVAYAAARFITIVPEVDLPGHTNAALASYPELNCDGVAPPLYQGIEVGFSALCSDREDVGGFVRDVVRELAAMTPGPYLHIGGDEVRTLTPDQYRRFIEWLEGVVLDHGKWMIGWGDIAPATLRTTSVVQPWLPDSSALHVARGGKVILSPASRTYLDMKYDTATVLGGDWAGYLEVQDAYGWDPPVFSGIPEASILGVEAPLWSETLVKLSDFEFMGFPRLTAIAEIAWSPAAGRDWAGFRLRLAAHGERLSALGVNFYRSPQIPWTR